MISNHRKALAFKDLIPTHNRLRSPERLKSIMNNTFSPANISLVDGKYLVHDGHHRLVCQYFSGIEYITDYILTEFSAKEYNQINLDVGYVTPFDVWNECRLPDFFKFKEIVLSKNISDIEYFVRKYKGYYCEPRRVFSIEQMANEASFAL